MLSVAVQKDIGEIKPKIIGPLTTRNLVCSLSAVGLGVLVSCYCFFLLHIPIDICMFLVIILSMPIWAVGFWRPYKMNLEDFFPLWVKFTFGKNLVVYKSSDILLGFDKINPPKQLSEERKIILGRKTDQLYDMLTKRPDVEAIDLDINVNVANISSGNNMDAAVKVVEEPQETIKHLEKEKLVNTNTSGLNVNPSSSGKHLKIDNSKLNLPKVGNENTFLKGN